MENFKVMYDDTVRDASGDIVQFNYGDDGFDAVHIVRLKIPEVLETMSRWELEYEDEMAVVREMDMLEKAVQYFEWWKHESGEELVSCPVDVEALFERAKILSVGSSNPLSLNTIWTRCWNLTSTISNELFKNYLILFLQLKRMTELNEVFFKWFLNTIWETYEKAKVQPGEMVGVLAAQSIAEPATQQVTLFVHILRIY
jgi:DNA-directed RNA polymerase II subunit RPB1